jgi:predicted Zn finger-like uncharacterized protein
MRSRLGANRVIVTCENCNTSFQLDDSQVPAEGVRVRCSRCKEAFFLQHPSASKQEAVERVVSQAIEGDGAAAPTPSADLDQKSHEPAAPSSDNAIPTDDDDESDWEFNVDPRGESKSEAAADPDAAMNFGSIGSDVGSGLSLEGEDEPQVAVEAEEQSPLVPEDLEESDFGSMDDYETDARETQGEEDMVDDSAPVIDDVSGPEIDRLAEQPAESSPVSAPASGEGSAESDNWDFFADDTQGPSSAAPGGDKAVLGRIRLASVEAGSAGLVDTIAGDSPFPSAGGLQDGAYGTDAAEPSKLWGAIAQVGHVVGWLSTVVLIAVGIAVVVKPAAESLTEKPRSVSFGELRADSISGHWIDTASGTTRYVVTGELTNPTERAVVLDPPPSIALKNTTGRSLGDGSSSWLGVAVGEPALRELGEEALRPHRGAAVDAFLRSPLQPGEHRPFQVVYESAPREAVVFELVSTKVETTPPPLLEQVEQVAAGPSD